MRWIKFTMSRGNDISLPMYKAEEIIADEGQLLAIYNDKGNWTGKTINKAHIVSTEFDLEKEKAENEKLKNNFKKIDEPRNTLEQIQEISIELEKLRKRFNFNRLRK